MPAGPLHILVVDDHFGSAFMMCEVLQRAGHHVRVAVGGHEAIRSAAAERTDAVLMDIHLPDLGGVDAAKRIKTLVPQVRMIGMSGMDVPQGDETGFVVFEERLHKPFQPEDLLGALDRLFGDRSPQ